MAISPFELIDGDYVALVQQLEKEQLQRLSLALKSEIFQYESNIKKVYTKKNSKKAFDKEQVFKKFNQKEQVPQKPRNYTFLIVFLCLILIFAVIFIGYAFGIDQELIAFFIFACVIVCVASSQAIREKNKKALKKAPPKFK